MVLWDFPEEEQDKLVQIALEKYGELKGVIRSPNSKIYFFDGGPSCTPRYIAAKAIVFDSSMPKYKQEKSIQRALYEITNTLIVCHHHLIHNFGDIQILWGIPFLISRKRQMTLRDVINDENINNAEILSTVIQICHAINYCKKQGLAYHQDLKPENIFIDFWPSEFPMKMKVAVADFELSNAYHFLQLNSGSRPYMPLEQYVTPGEVLGNDLSKIDVFALGVMMVEMLTRGIHPIGKRTCDIWPKPLETESKKWSSERPWKQWLKKGAKIECEISGVDSELICLIQDCLQVDVSHRITVKQLEDRLLDMLKTLDPDIFNHLSLNLQYLDDLAKEGNELGWPHMEELVDKINQAFSGKSAH